MKEIFEAFQFEGSMVSCERYGSGHINETYKLITDGEGGQKEYILQKINHQIFKDVPGLMRNIEGVTTFLRKMIINENGDPDRET